MSRSGISSKVGLRLRLKTYQEILMKEVYQSHTAISSFHLKCSKVANICTNIAKREAGLSLKIDTKLCKVK